MDIKLSAILLLISSLFCASCSTTGMEGRYKVNIEETKKNITDERQKSIMGMIEISMSKFEFEIKGNQFLMYDNNFAADETYAISNDGNGILTIIDKGKNDIMKLKYDSGKILMKDPVMGIDIIFTKK